MAIDVLDELGEHDAKTERRPVMSDRLQRDEFFLTTAEVADRLRVHQRTVQNLIERKELGAIRVGSDYRIPVPALDAYLRRQATTDETREQLPRVTTPSIAELRGRVAEFEARHGMRTSEFLARYNDDQDAPSWTAEHHRWAAIAEALETVAVA